MVLSIWKNDILSNCKYSYLFINSFKNRCNIDFNIIYSSAHFLDLIPFVTRNHEFFSTLYNKNWILNSISLRSLAPVTLNQFCFYTSTLFSNSFNKEFLDCISKLLVEYKWALYGTAQTFPKYHSFFYTTYESRRAFYAIDK
jgi:hypothetical protein